MTTPRAPTTTSSSRFPHVGGYEVLWRDDNVYDLLAVVGYNDDPVVPGAGSAIFVHIARPGLTPTTGCIGVAVDDLLELPRLHQPRRRRHRQVEPELNLT